MGQNDLIDVSSGLQQRLFDSRLEAILEARNAHLMIFTDFEEKFIQSMLDRQGLREIFGGAVSVTTRQMNMLKEIADKVGNHRCGI